MTNPIIESNQYQSIIMPYQATRRILGTKIEQANQMIMQVRKLAGSGVWQYMTTNNT